MLYQGALAKGYSLVDFCQVAWHGLKLDLTVAGYLTAVRTLAGAGLECLPGCCKSIGRGAFRGGPDSLWLLGLPAGRDTVLLHGIAR